MAGEPSSRIGLVLGAGGVLGGAWLVGALHAIATETGWDPGSSDVIVGTSAGSMIGALTACGVPPWFMVAHSGGEQLDGLADANGGRASDGDRSAGAGLRLQVPALGPGSWRLALSSLARPYRHAPATLVAGWLPHGPFSTEPLQDTVRRICSERWAPHPAFWTVAVDYATGRRVVFGRKDAPRAGLPEAVAASCAIPGFYRSVEIAGRRYVDGGLHSMSNLDVVDDQRPDLVICLNPTSSLHARGARSLGDRLAMPLRTASGRRLGSEARRLRETGAEVVLVQPTVHDLDAMGTNLMSRARRHQVIETAVETMTQHLRETPLGERLAELPRGRAALVRRPPGPPSDWPDFRELARGRWTADERQLAS